MNMANTTKVNTIYVPLDNITYHINSKSCLYKSITADIDVYILRIYAVILAFNVKLIKVLAL